MINESKQNNDEKVNRIIKFRESIKVLPDSRFFELMRTYLGEIKTPFNKQNLIENLSVIFRKKENQELISAYLSDFDKKLLTAVSMFSKAEQHKVISFFQTEYKLSEIYTELLNLLDRLLIFSYKNTYGEIILDINPLLEDTIKPYINLKTLFPSEDILQKYETSQFEISPLFISGVLSYLSAYPEMCKNDSTLKKKDIERLNEIFPNQTEEIKLLVKSFFNLGIILQSDSGLVINQEKLKVFSELEETSQYAYITVASVVNLGREALQKLSQLLLDTINAIPDEGLSKTAIMQSSLLISQDEDTEELSKVGRFRKILAERYNPAQLFSNKLMEDLIENAINFGLIKKIGITKNQKEIFIKSQIFEKSQNLHGQKFLNLSSGVNATILPGLPLSILLPLTAGMTIISCKTASEYEFTKKSIIKAFDKGQTPKDIFFLLQQNSSYPIPQSLVHNIEDWYNSYSAVQLYCGYILKVDEKNIRFVENNPKISTFIKQKLSEGVYLLNFSPDKAPEEFISASGLDFMGCVKTAAQEKQTYSFMSLRNNTKKNLDLKNNDKNLPNLPTEQSIKDEFYKILNEMNLPQALKESLADRIEKKIIITKEQLNPATVRLEILDADAMDFSGKLRLLENAEGTKNLAEITFPSAEKIQTFKTYIGIVLAVNRHESDATLEIKLHPEEEIKFFSVSRINHVKIIKTAVLEI